MNKEQIVYEREICHSYMKVPALEEDELDVRIMLQRDIKGMISVERCYVNENGQYWYDISGKQALDGFLGLHMLTYALFEKIILRISEQLEILEWNLLDRNGLWLDPEHIFLTHQGEHLFFVFYPHEKTDVMQNLQKLLEYLLSKLDHSERELVQGAYEVYEMLLAEDCDLQKIKNTLLKQQISQEKQVEEVELQKEELFHIEEHTSEEKSLLKEIKEGLLEEQVKERAKAWFQKIVQFVWQRKKEDIPQVLYPQEEEKTQTVVHPTVCITGMLEEPKGVLLYEGIGGYSNFELHQRGGKIGKSPEVDFQIDKETISHFHAKIEYREGYYIEDINSTNGTFVNEEMLNYKESKKLYAGDSIRFADVKYRFF